MTELRVREVRGSRKVHVCDWCLRRIEPGEPYRYSFVTDGGDCYSWHECSDCTPYVQELCAEDPQHAQDLGYTTSEYMEWMEERHPGILPHKKPKRDPASCPNCGRHATYGGEGDEGGAE